jgi:uncharacterized protein with PIN domain
VRAHLLVKSVEEIPPNNIGQKYVVDSMFGGLARKLRILGIDSYYASDLRDEDVIQIGLEQNRTIITADRELFSRTVNKKVPAVLLTSSDDLHNAAMILKYHHKEIKFDPSSARCSKCNGILINVSKEMIREKIKEGVYNNYEVFFECKGCSKVYWIGTHITEIQSWIDKLNETLFRVSDD